MRKLVVFLGVMFFSGAFAQETPKEKSVEGLKEATEYWRKNGEKFQKDMKKLGEELKENMKYFKEGFSKFSFAEKKEFFQQMQVQNIIKKLDLPKEKSELVEKKLQEYFKKKDDILKEFKQGNVKKELSDKEARQRLQESVEVAQKLLDNRKLYIEEFLKVLTPQQVLEVLKIEKNSFYSFKTKYQEKKNNR